MMNIDNLCSLSTRHAVKLKCKLSVSNTLFVWVHAVGLNLSISVAASYFVFAMLLSWVYHNNYSRHARHRYNEAPQRPQTQTWLLCTMRHLLVRILSKNTIALLASIYFEKVLIPVPNYGIQNLDETNAPSLASKLRTGIRRIRKEHQSTVKVTLSTERGFYILETAWHDISPRNKIPTNMRWHLAEQGNCCNNILNSRPCS